MTKPNTTSSSPSEMFRDLQTVLDESLPQPELHVLEAGCGSATHVKLPHGAKVAGIDISARQLERNSAVAERIVGDIQTYDLGRDRFDLIICWHVLEHVKRPELAIDRFLSASKPGGIILLAFPNVRSLWGLITKFTPHWFHVFYYRRILGRPNAGRGDTAPFPTVLDWSIAPTRIRRQAANSQFEVIFERFYDPQLGTLRRRFWLGAVAYELIARSLFVITLGKLGGVGNSGWVAVLKRMGSTGRDERPARQ